ncbi:NUDIX hydrolase [Glutamicibacter bergerei]|jgi:8-oxo-dGTP pyrophosphatase MutT (NUDIX family)|uniref:NUDIX hydrolase n=1 Tax=Glutamicibacter ardleyensis TaxID=225894 RepID=A0ABQ2DG54_9MICC|nr:MULTISPECIES: NUDIX domain-containing protein [Glutamicibacter]PCC33200.1 DNA mismatch repair protein MutT [Glutamicibacter sp. BW77]GGJ54622.1 NUDIX hydrolase [Glutamicibacter ardleyensis]
MTTPEFITDLRTRIGHDLLWLSGVKVVVFNGSQVLLVRRVDNGLWTLPAGIIEPGDEASHTAVREVLEETGVRCELTHLLGVGVTAPATYPNGDHAQYLDIVFRAIHLGGEARINDDENLEVGYFELSDRPSLPPLHERAIDWALNPKPGGYFA